MGLGVTHSSIIMIIENPEKHPRFDPLIPDAFWDHYFRLRQYYTDGITLQDALFRYKDWLRDKVYSKKQIIWKLQKWATRDEVKKIMILK